MRRRLVVLLSVLAVGGIAAPRAAVGGPAVCNLIVDRAGDANNFAGADGSLDVVSADLASDATTVTAVFRLKKFDAVSPGAPQGRHYYLLFQPAKPTIRLFLNVTVLQGGVARYAWGAIEPIEGTGITFYNDGQYGVLNPATGFIDAGKNEIHVSALVKDVAAKGDVKPEGTIKRLEAATFYSAGLFIFPSDTATAKTNYVAGTPSCVKPGK